MVSVLRAGRNKQLLRAFLRAFSPLGLALLTLLLAAPPSPAAAAPGTVAAARAKTVRYRGYSVRVPAAWPVYQLSAHAHTCVRFDRHAVYLGTPSSSQSCPGHLAGRTEAILISPSPGPASRGGSVQALARLAPGPMSTPQERETQLTNAAHGVTVTATWNRAPQVIRSALGVTTLTREPTASFGTQARFQSHARFGAQARRAANDTATTFTGRGFDACATPSESTMSAWGSSLYRALGIYIGGANSACAQPNLNTAWMEAEWAAGWHMVPIYVGLQAPSNSCGCAAMTGSKAANEGTAAAQDAVAQAQAVGIGAGNPIYNDMEGYSRTSNNTNAVLNFLAAWTTQLHAEGYVSGVYSSGGSGVADLVSRYGTGYTEPDDIWVADWNGSASTDDSYLPAAGWPSHQRLHQYRGAHNETYGGATLNIDSDYLDGATAYGGTATPAASPFLQVAPTTNGTVNLTASWPGETGISRWQTLGGTDPSALGSLGTSPVTGGATSIAEHSAFPYYAIQAVGVDGQVMGTSATVSTRPHVALYGRSAFVPRTGLTGIPAGCFTGAACRLSATVTAGRKLIAKTGAEQLNTPAGLIFFTLNATGRKLLSTARGRRLPVRVSIHDVSGRSASALISLIPYTTLGSGPRRSATSSSEVKLLGLRDFVFGSSTGGILAGCYGPAPCLIKTTISAGHQTVAVTKPEFVGANTAGYLSYRLTGYGRHLLAAAKGNELGAQVTLSIGASAGGSGSSGGAGTASTASSTSTARAHISLSSFR
jgi:hypothetical protein